MLCHDLQEEGPVHPATASDGNQDLLGKDVSTVTESKDAGAVQQECVDGSEAVPAADTGSQGLRTMSPKKKNERNLRRSKLRRAAAAARGAAISTGERKLSSVFNV